MMFGDNEEGALLDEVLRRVEPAYAAVAVGLEPAHALLMWSFHCWLTRIEPADFIETP